jgi:hypothetical protein
LAILFERKMQLRRKLWSGTHKDKGKEELAENNMRGSPDCWEDTGRNLTTQQEPCDMATPTCYSN